jgi:dTDP-glucose 4,6-dehydratase
MSTALVTGGAGFIGTALCARLLGSGVRVLSVDKLTYAGNPAAVEEARADARYRFFHVDICDRAALDAVFREEEPASVYHLAAESHVDHSIADAAPFVTTNVVGTYTLLEASLHYWGKLDPARKSAFRFVHVSTDEVYGSLGPEGAFTEESPHQPNNPYSASKAASDHFVRAFHRTFGLPTLTTHCSNNFGPWQYPEKLVPVVILSALRGLRIPVYGTGTNEREWLFVDDHARALVEVCRRGRPGETYNIGSSHGWTNLALVEAICRILDEVAPSPRGGRHCDAVSLVEDRPGHDLRYAIDASKIASELGWRPAAPFAESLELTVRWYLDHLDWCEEMQARRRSRS